MTGDVGIVALYHDQDPERPNENGMRTALACVIAAMLKLHGREYTADFFDKTADAIRSGELWTLGEQGPWGTA